MLFISLLLNGKRLFISGSNAEAVLTCFGNKVFRWFESNLPDNSQVTELADVAVLETVAVGRVSSSLTLATYCGFV